MATMLDLTKNKYSSQWRADNAGVQDALSALLKSLGFTSMAADVLKEKDESTLKKYAAIVHKQVLKEHPEKAEELKQKLSRLGLM